MNESEQVDIELEISDLPGADNRSVPPLLRKMAAHPRLRSRLWQVGTGIVILFLLFVLSPDYLPLLQNNLPGIFAHPTPAITSQSSLQDVPQHVKSQYNAKNIFLYLSGRALVVTSPAPLNAAPQNCPQYTLTQNFDAPSIPAGVGGVPMWVTGFAGPRATLNHFVRAQQPEFGWRQQILLVGETNFNGTVTLKGGVVGNLFPLWFGVYPHDGPLITTVQVNPLDTSRSNHTTDDQQWGTLPINLYIAFASCYYLQATWNGGSWTAYFAAGR